MSARIELKNINQSFVMGDSQVTLFNQLDLSLQQGKSYAIIGPSGAGKSSLLMIASGLEKPTTGSVLHVKDGQCLPLTQVREKIGFIFQQYHLLPELTALNNVALPLKLRGDKRALDKAANWLDKVGLAHRKDHKPTELSGGEQQRIAIARALVFEPEFIFADEPTGNLDPSCATEIADLLLACVQEQGAGLVIVTHSEALANRTETTYRLFNSELISPKPLPLVASL